MADAVAAKLPFAVPFPLDDNHPQNWMVDQLVRNDSTLVWASSFDLYYNYSIL